MLLPSVAPKLHPAALSPADVALFPTSPGAAEGSETGGGEQQKPVKYVKKKGLGALLSILIARATLARPLHPTALASVPSG